MHKIIHNVLPILLQQGLTMSIAAHDFARHSFMEDTPQAQGMSIPIFGKDCASKRLA